LHSQIAELKALLKLLLNGSLSFFAMFGISVQIDGTSVVVKGPSPDDPSLLDQISISIQSHFPAFASPNPLSLII